MGWIISIILLFNYSNNGDYRILISAGLFAIAGAIAFNCGNKE